MTNVKYPLLPGYAYYGRHLFLLQDGSAVVMKKELKPIAIGFGG